MDTLFESLATLNDRPLGTVLHIGAGNGLVLARYADLAPERVVLVEGDTDTAAQLQRRAAGLRWAEVRAQAVAPKSGALAWRRYTLPMLNGPVDSAALASMYPRLRLVGNIELQAVALAELVADLALTRDAGQQHVLVLDVPGQEAALLASLPDSLLTAFDAVLIKSCREALNPGAASLEQVLEQLCSRCYLWAAGGVQHEPLWPVSLLRLDAQRYQTGLLQQALAALQRDAQTHGQTVAALQAENASLTAQVQSLNLLVSEGAEQTTQRLARIDELARSLEHANSAAAQSQTDIDSLGQVNAALTQGLQSRAAESAQLTEQLHSLALTHQQAQADMAQQVQGLQRDLADARQTAALSVRLQTLRETDLRELQGRYETVIVQQQSQHALLTQLAQRLTVANQYFHQLVQTNPSITVLPAPPPRSKRRTKQLSLAAAAAVQSDEAIANAAQPPASSKSTKTRRRSPAAA
jgi:FkbM family methyltransferase